MTMAIPFTLPSDQETEENYRRLNQLLLDLYEVIQILIRPPRTQVSGVRMRHGDEEGGTRREPPTPVFHQNQDIQNTIPSEARIVSTSNNDRGLPDLVLSSMPQSSRVQGNRKVLPPRRQRRKQISKTEKAQRASSQAPSINLAFGMEHHASSSSHHQVSNRVTSSLEGEESVCSETKSIKVSASSLVSLLVPASISGHIWTTIIIIVGWRLLARQR